MQSRFSIQTLSLSAATLLLASCSVYQSGDRTWFDSNAAKTSASSLIDPQAERIGSIESPTCFVTQATSLLTLATSSSEAKAEFDKPITFIAEQTQERLFTLAVVSLQPLQDGKLAAFCEFSYASREALNLDLEPAMSRARIALEKLHHQTHYR